MLALYHCEPFNLASLVPNRNGPGNQAISLYIFLVAHMKRSARTGGISCGYGEDVFALKSMMTASIERRFCTARAVTTLHTIMNDILSRAGLDRTSGRGLMNKDGPNEEQYSL